MKAKKMSLESVEQAVLKVTTHPIFLGGVGLVLNASAYRKLFQKKILQSLWGRLELPSRAEQEKALYLLSEVENRLSRLERRLHHSAKSAAQNQEREPSSVRRPFFEDSSIQ